MLDLITMLDYTLTLHVPDKGKRGWDITNAA